MSSKHHRWQIRWALDLSACQATHECGLVVRFTETAGAWDGQPVDDQVVFAQLLAKHGPHNIGPHIARLVREAGELYREALDARH